MSEYFDEPIDFEVITVLGASTLTGRATPAIRHAAREGLVKTEAVLQIEVKATRLLCLKSVLEYWKVPPQREKEIENMRRSSFVIESGRQRFRILHPWYPVYTRPLYDRPPAETTNEAWFSGDD